MTPSSSNGPSRSTSLRRVDGLARVTGFLARSERFGEVASTNDIVRGWLAEGTPEVCLAIADTQTAGRGREGRTWVAPAGASLLLSLGFRPAWLAVDRVWQLAAITSLAMADAAEAVTGLPEGTVRLKWPNDLVVEGPDGRVRKLAGVLGETDGLGTDDPRAVVGIGTNVDWSAADFPPGLADTMTSLRDTAGDRPVDRDALTETFVENVGRRLDALRAGDADEANWTARQSTSGRLVELVHPDGTIELARALGVDATTGALIVEDDTAPEGRRPVVVGEIRHARLGATVGV
jgi:BirA family transcriptional regulator, biotin operon repressor / biotin---[acetyl-CoA-carboxylase] ligase